MAGDLFGVEPPRAASGASGSPAEPQSTSPPGGSIGFAAELYLGPAGAYSYSPGGAGYLPGVVFASTLKRFTFRCSAMAEDVTVRLRTEGGTEVYSKVLTAGQTLIDEAVSIAVAAGVRIQGSVTPTSGGPTIDVWHFGWTREIA